MVLQHESTVEGEEGEHRVRVLSDLEAIEGALMNYMINNLGSYPATLEPLWIPDENGYTYLRMRSEPLDPWQVPYRYEAPDDNSEEPRIFTFGADNAEGGEDENEDIDNSELPGEGSY